MELVSYFDRILFMYIYYIYFILFLFILLYILYICIYLFYLCIFSQSFSALNTPISPFHERLTLQVLFVDDVLKSRVCMHFYHAFYMLHLPHCNNKRWHVSEFVWRQFAETRLTRVMWRWMRKQVPRDGRALGEEQMKVPPHPLERYPTIL
jgi:hypothetical protein